MHTSANLVLLGAVDQGIWATMIKHAIDRIILSADKRYLNRMRYVEPEFEMLLKSYERGYACLVIDNQL